MIRATRLLVTGLLAAVLVAGAGAGAASAHALSTSSVLLDVQSDHVAGEVQLPLDRLAVALDRKLTPAAATGPLRATLEDYTRRHIAASGADGRAWAVAVSGGRIETINGTAHLVMAISLTPPDGKVTAFDLRYDVIIEQLVTHKAFATIRTQWDKGTTARNAEPLGVFEWDRRSLTVDADGGSWLRGFTSSAGLGVEHIAQGADHLLFLLMLLIPAPLVARRGRWRPSGDARRSGRRIIHVVTAFAVGHSITLALAGLGVVHVPTRLVESLIALSILVSAIHAIRPLVPGGEAAIAAGFGLVHGLAFAALIGDLGLDRGSLLSSLLGFNLGIEVTQLLVVVLMMPSLYLLSETAVYAALRVGVASLGAVLATAWLLERTTLTDSDPFAPFTDALVGHPFTVAAALALAAACSHYAPSSMVGRSEDTAMTA